MVKISLEYVAGVVILRNESTEIIVIDTIGGKKVDPMRINPGDCISLQIKDRPEKT